MTLNISGLIGEFSQSYADMYDEEKKNLLAGIGETDLPSLFSLERFSDGIGILYLLFIVISIVLYIFRKTVVAVLSKFCICICPCLNKKHAHDDECRDKELAAGLDTFSRDFLADLRMETLVDKYRKAVNDLHDATKYEVSEESMMN